MALVHENSFFPERAAVLLDVDALLATDDADEASRIVDRIAKILDKYQEQPHLLDPAFPAIVGPVMQRARELLRSRFEERQRQAEEAALLGMPAGAFPFQLDANTPYLSALFTLVYRVSKLRGRKAVVKLFPHSVADVEPVLECLLGQDAAAATSLWELRFVLLLWLSILVLVPFDLRSLDSSADATAAATAGAGAGAAAGSSSGSASAAAGGSGGIIARLVTACQAFLLESGNAREAGALCVSRLLSRPDMDASHLRRFCDWACRALAVCADSSTAAAAPVTALSAALASSAAEAEVAFAGAGASGSGDAFAPSAATAIRPGGAAPSAAVVAAATAGVTSESAFVAAVTRELGIPAGAVSGASRTFLATGVLQALVETAKHGHRAALRDVLPEALSRVLAILGLADTGDDDDADDDGDDGGEVGGRAGAGGSNKSASRGTLRAGAAAGVSGAVASLRASPLLRKLLVKLASRTALATLPPRVMAWRYQRGQRSLLENLSLAGVAAAKAKALDLHGAGDGSAVKGRALAGAAAASAAGGARGIAGAASAASSALSADAGIGEDDVPAELESVLDMLLQGLRDGDTVVRWSAAKGVGRVTARLPLSFADDVVAAVMGLLSPSEGDGAWHGGCLALAELARRGLLLPSRLPAVVPLVLAALRFDVRRGAHSVGAHVRDAACYVCWAFARAYDPAVMRPHVLALARGMLVTALFDREVNCRRAASAAFQENVGRQGHGAFPDGIAILTLADYFTLGNRGNAFAVVAPRVAVFPAYRYALLDHLLTVKLRHWDRAVRGLAAQALGRMAHLDVEWVRGVALPTLLPLVVAPELYTRHGAVAAIAELVLAVAAVPATLPQSTLDAVRNVVVKAEKARAYTGRGGEMVRAAMCRLIACQCLADHALSRRAALRLLQTVDDCLKHPNDAIQAAALEALRALTAHALSTPEQAVLERLPIAYLTRLNSDDNPAVRRGVALALGALPRSLLTAPAPAPGPGGQPLPAGVPDIGEDGSPRTLLDSIIDGLIAASKQEKQAVKRDAETRRNAVMGLTDLVETVGFGARAVVDVLIARAGSGGDSAEAPSTASSAPHLFTPADAYDAHVASETPPGLTSAQLARIWDALYAATHDYATDNRGDVGSWVRKAALEGLERVAAQVQAACLVEARITALLARCSATSTAAGAAGTAAAAGGSERAIPCPPEMAHELQALATPGLGRLAVDRMTAAALAAGRSLAASSAAAAGGAAGGTVADASASAAAAAAAAIASSAGAGSGSVSGFNASITGYGAGTRLLASAPHQWVDALLTASGIRLGSAVATQYGPGVVTKIMAAGAVCEVDFRAAAVGPHGSAAGASSGYAAAMFPYGVALMRSERLRPLSGHSAVAAGVSGTAGVSVDASRLRLVRMADGGAGLHAFLSPHRVAGQLLGALLRAACEKLDLLRGVAGEGLCRVLHLPHPLPPLPHVAHRATIEAACPASPAAVLSRYGGARLGGGRAEDAAAVASAVAAAAGSHGDDAAATAAASAAVFAAAAAHTALALSSAPLLAHADEEGGDGEHGPEDEEEAEGDGSSVGHADEGGSTSAAVAGAAAAVASGAVAGGAAAAAGAPVGSGSGSGSGSGIQWSLPHHSFPRLVPLLGHGLPYVRPIVAGLVTAVGGLSESVVKASSAALTAWASEQRRGGRHAVLAEVAAAVSAMMSHRPLQAWDALVEGAGPANWPGAPAAALAAAAAGAGAGGGKPAYYNPSAAAASASGAGGSADPSMSRWFKEILGTAGAGAGGRGGAGGKGAAAAAAPAGSGKLDTRLVTPALRTLETLLRCGCLDGLQPPAFPDFGRDAVAAAVKRAHNARDDAVRVMACGDVFLALLHFPPDARGPALRAVLDLLGHPFPRVRKVAAERLYVRLLELEDDVLVAHSDAEGGAGGAAAGASVPAALAALTETPWDAPVSSVLPARDRLYGLLGMAIPDSRSGFDAAIFAGTSVEAGGHAAEGAFTRTGDDVDGDAAGYGALVREMGF